MTLPNHTPTNVITIIPDLRLRFEPKLGSRILAFLDQNTQLEVIEETETFGNTWYKVQLTGYVMTEYKGKSFIEPLDTEQEASAPCPSPP